MTELLNNLQTSPEGATFNLYLVQIKVTGDKNG